MSSVMTIAWPVRADVNMLVRLPLLLEDEEGREEAIATNAGGGSSSEGSGGGGSVLFSPTQLMAFSLLVAVDVGVSAAAEAANTSEVA